jgi:23S rRNA (cytosine1962-C5)-methyltransferase/23S rRNA (guanine2445-N2)-methyltransferase / 23S rRNA (guanine2069-N7)-methyltransferase
MKGNTVNRDPSALKNRLAKNQKKLKSYLNKNQIKAYRIYNKDIPEYPYLIDVYGDSAVIYEQGKKLGEEDQTKREEHQADIEVAISDVLGISTNKQFFPFKFLINLERYLDTGLFLDHRPLRQHLYLNSKDKKVLNLFCYTGSISVACALGGGIVTSIDMSNTYLQWAYENFLLNKIDPKQHSFYQADVLKELHVRKESKESFDIIILDPPSFSNSKRMEEDLDIERDHPLLIRDCMNLLAPGGTLYFSTNKRKFELHRIISDHYKVKEISQWTIPQDFHQTNIHRAFTIER